MGGATRQATTRSARQLRIALRLGNLRRDSGVTSAAISCTGERLCVSVCILFRDTHLASIDPTSWRRKLEEARNGTNVVRLGGGGECMGVDGTHQGWRGYRGAGEGRPRTKRR